MRHRVSFLSIALLLTAVAGMAQPVDYLRVLLRRPVPWALKSPEVLESRPEGESRPEIGETIEWRAMTMRDEYGEIPSSARYQANLERRQNLARPRGRFGGLTANSASINPASWVSRGPNNVGGRTRALLIDSNNPSIMYAGAATGGVWKSVNSGATWSPLTDFMTNINISAMVMDPINHDIIYAGTGEGPYSTHGDDGLPGAGIFKTTDGGIHWTQLQETAGWRYVRGLSMKPGTSGVLLAANELGLWRSDNGGGSWVQVRAGSARVVAFSPNDGLRAVADIETPTGRNVVYSTDGGGSFSNATLSSDLPFTTNRIAVAWGAGSTVYVNLGDSSNDKEGFLGRSDNGGQNFVLVSSQKTSCYASCSVWASPASNWLVVGGNRLLISGNGGLTYGGPIDGGADLNSPWPHSDTHAIVSHPSSVNKVYVVGDGGIYVTSDITRTEPCSGTGFSPPCWSVLNTGYQTAQFYAAAGISVGGNITIIGGTQDNAVLRVLSSSTNATQMINESDGGFVAIDPVDPNYMYAATVYYPAYRSTDGGQSAALMTGLTARTAIMPLVLDPNNHNTLFSAGEGLSRTTNATAFTPTWNTISPTSASLISAVAVAKGNSNIIWIGRLDGTIQQTIYGGNPYWTSVDAGLPDRSVLRILIDPDNSNRVYVALGGYTANSPTPQNLWRTTDGGVTWQPVSGSGSTALPPVPIRAIARHPRNQQRLYVGTDIGIYESEDGGATWSTQQQGPADVTTDDLSFIAGSETLLAATHGRGLWTADTSSVPTYQGVAAPTGLSATASGTATVDVSWTAVGGATQYQLFRSVDGSVYTERALPQSTFYQDTAVVENKTYLYKVRAWSGGTWSDLSAPDLATTIVFDDDNALTGHLVTAALMQQLHTAVNAVRSSAGLPPLSGPPAVGSPITAASLISLRTALSNAYSAIGMPAVLTFNPLASGNPVNASFFQEVRNAVK